MLPRRDVDEEQVGPQPADGLGVDAVRVRDQGEWLALRFLVQGQADRRGRSEIALRSASERTLVSNAWRPKAMPIPMTRPARRPSARLRLTLGENGPVCGDGRDDGRGLDGLVVLASRGENFAATGRCRPDSVGARAAPERSLLTAVMSRTDACGGAEAKRLDRNPEVQLGAERGDHRG